MFACTPFKQNHRGFPCTPIKSGVEAASPRLGTPEAPTAILIQRENPALPDDDEQVLRDLLDASGALWNEIHYSLDGDSRSSVLCKRVRCPRAIRRESDWRVMSSFSARSVRFVSRGTAK